VILIPVKLLNNAKQRLAPVLEQPARVALAQAMLLDVAEEIGKWNERPEVALVTSDPYALTIAPEFDFQIIPDHDNLSETDAIEMATRECVERGVKWTMVIPGDIPLVESRELQQVLAAAPQRGSVLVPGWDGRGTNAVLRTPADLFPLRFGNDSFKPHLAAAQATGAQCVTLSLSTIGLDVDNPDDLKQLVEAPGERRSQQLARQWSMAGYP
jgi:2-phospho-L-lactate guanylyltransferase